MIYKRKYDVIHDVTNSKKYSNFLPVEYVFPHKHFLKILWKSELFPEIKKGVGVFSEHGIVR